MNTSFPRRRAAAVLFASLVLTGGLALAQQATKGPAPSALQGRIQAYLDEWRAASTFRGASVGIALPDGG